MTIPQAIFLGLIEGITEFLPISSTAHLIVAQRMMGVVVSEFFTVVVQLGAIAGLVYVERTVLSDMVKELFGYLFSSTTPSKQVKQQTTVLSLRAVQIAIATFPIIVVGFLIKDYLGMAHDNFALIAVTSIVTGIVLLVAERYSKKHATSEKRPATTKQFFVMGIFQVLSLIPGTSRSGITAAGGAFQKMSLPQALEYSFLLSIPALGLAGVYELLKATSNPIDSAILLPTLVGSVIAFMSAVIGIEWLRATVRRFGFLPFVLYRFVFALFLLFLY